MKSYDVFIDYYDKIVRGINSPLDEEVDFLNEQIKKNNSNSKTILELACGTGVVAKEFQKLGYEVTGLDINEKMLEKAKENIDEKNLILGDMTNFDLEKKFDVVLCNYNSICHLLEWNDWQNFFKMAYNHLNDGGILIFDINTLFEFENITREFSMFYNFGEDSVCLEMFKKNGFYEWLVKIFKKSNDGRYDLIQEVIKENSFPIKMIKKELKEKKFRVLEIIDFHYGELNEESERVYFICKKISN
ncbi:MAG: class I SAM-dependent methyltransferase [Candidatus Gracilibacteria bacterium]|nr:class I SAM-dependent methyltransferase [Candidatus Gracilibacteria bacterium]